MNSARQRTVDQIDDDLRRAVLHRRTVRAAIRRKREDIVRAEADLLATEQTELDADQLIARLVDERCDAKPTDAADT